MSASSTSVEARIRFAFAAAGVTGWLHVCDVDDQDRGVAVGADHAVVLSSVFKLPVLVELHRRADAGALELTQPVTVTERTVGTAGLAAMSDPVTMSLRDLAYLMIAVSDLAAADVLFDRLGAEAIDATMRGLGLEATRIVGCSRDLVAAMMHDTGATSAADLAERLRAPGVAASLSVLDPQRTNRSTPRDMTRLLSAVWRDEAAGPDSCAAMRRVLGLQVWPHRLASGFPSDEIAVAGKTGTLPTVRNEVGVVGYPDGKRYAAAVFTRARSTAMTLPQADAVIGTTARMAVDALRSRG